MGETEDVVVDKHQAESETADELEKENGEAEPLDEEDEPEDLEDGEDSPKRTARALEENWEESFNKLLKFRTKHGHCNVPSRYPGDPHLGSWVATQRRQYRIMVSGSGLSTPMTEARALRLESIGFKWSSKDPRHIPWEARYDELMAFVKKFGHAQVPIGWTENVSLANWVSTQRQEYKLLQKGRSNRLTPERMRLLNEVGFIWEAQRGGPRRLKKARVSVPARPTPKPPSRTRGGRGGASAATMPRTDMQGLGSSDAVVSRMQDAASALNPVPGAQGQVGQDATLQLLINQQQALLESQRRNAALLTAMQPQLGMQGMNPLGGLATSQFTMPGSAFLMPQQFAAMPILYTANGMPFQLQPLNNNPFSPVGAAAGLQPSVFPNMALQTPMDQAQQLVALQQQQSAGVADAQTHQSMLQGMQAAASVPGGMTSPQHMVSPQQLSSVSQSKAQNVEPTSSAPADEDYDEEENGYDDGDDENEEQDD